MGREALATCTFKGETAQVKVLLESSEIILRGPIRARLARQNLSSIKVDGNTLMFKTHNETLSLVFDVGEADKWLLALHKQPPSLADKLGISASKKTYVIGQTDDAALKLAIKDCLAATPEDAKVLLAILRYSSELDEMRTVIIPYPERHVWCIYPKGKHASITDREVRCYMREHGYIDNKTCAVSDDNSATRYRLNATP
jgi:hypothetical protein